MLKDYCIALCSEKRIISDSLLPALLNAKENNYLFVTPQSYHLYPIFQNQNLLNFWSPYSLYFLSIYVYYSIAMYVRTYVCMY